MSSMKDKIKGLLSKANGTDNEHEAEIFMAKAMELMEKHQISITDMDNDDPVGMDALYKASTSHPSYIKHLWWKVSSYYGYRAVMSPKAGNKYHMEVVGRESARVTTELMMPFILKQVRDKGRELAEETGQPVQRCIRDVANALVYRLAGILSERKKDAPKTQAAKNALVTVDAVQAFIDSRYATLGKAKGRGLTSTAEAHGKASSISLHRQTERGTTKLIGNK